MLAFWAEITVLAKYDANKFFGAGCQDQYVVGTGKDSSLKWNEIKQSFNFANFFQIHYERFGDSKIFAGYTDTSGRLDV